MTSLAFRSPGGSDDPISKGPALRRAPGSIEPPPVRLRLPVQIHPVPDVPQGTEPPRWWWLGCHGGAGVSTLARLIPGGWDAGRAWPDPRLGGPAGVLLVCRSNDAGLTAASTLLRQWHSGYTPAHLAIWGLVVMADAPGRTPKRLVAMRDRLAGTVQRLMIVPWVDAWRVEAAIPANSPKEIARIGVELRSRPWIAHLKGMN